MVECEKIGDGEELSSSTIAGGAVIDALNGELRKAFKNMVDPNTSEETVRVVKLEIRIKPGKNRATAQVAFTCSSKLANEVPVMVEVSVVPMQTGRMPLVREVATLSLPGME